MYYYYDVLLNFTSEGELYEFYEWEENDNVEFVKKIPIFRVPTEVVKDNLQYQTKFDKEIVLQIAGKTMIKGNKENIGNTFLISDAKNALALELDETGKVISRSKLLPSDELNLSEVMFTMKESNLSYEKGKKYKEETMLRQEREIKKLITCEIKTLYEKKNTSKLKYLYYEWFNKNIDNVQEIYEEMIENLQKTYDDNLKRVYELIKLSYHNIH